MLFYSFLRRGWIYRLFGDSSVEIYYQLLAEIIKNFDFSLFPHLAVTRIAFAISADFPIFRRGLNRGGQREIYSLLPPRFAIARLGVKRALAL